MDNSFDLNNLNSFDLNKLNSFISSASEAIACNSDCQKQKNAELLKQKYLDSKTNLITAPIQVQVAEKNYVTFTRGEAVYDEQLYQELTNKAKTISDKFKSTFDAESKKVKSQIDTYNGLTTNFYNIEELYLQYKKENSDLSKKLKVSTNDVLTNERKTYYEDQNIDNLKGYYFYILLIIYIIFVVAFGVFSLTYSSQSSAIMKLGVFILLIVLPFFSTWLLGSVIYFLHILYNFLPKNVYM